jgi:hypothetical protein
MANLIGSRKESPIWNLEEIVMSPAEIEAQERLAKQKSPSMPIQTPASSQPIITPDDNPPQIGLTSGWLYVPSIGMEFSPTLDGFSNNWYDAHKFVRAKKLIMPSPDETWALFFEAKTQIAKPEFRKVYEFFTQKTPVNTWHGEWQDAFFKEENGKMYIQRLKDFKANGNPEFHQGKDITGTYLASDCYADISQKTNITSQGLCKVASAKNSYEVGNNIYNWYPRDGAVARFSANSVGAFLYCYRDPSFSVASLGVRLARRVAPSVVQKSGGSK